MTRRTIVSLVGLSAVLAAAGCGDKPPPVGTERGACYGNGTCNDGLVCMSDLCVMPPPPDCTEVATKLGYLMLSNYAKKTERADFVSATVTTCKQAELTQSEADCLLRVKDRGSLRHCPKPLVLGSCERALAHANRIVAGNNPALAKMMDQGPALRRCQERGISRVEEACVLGAKTKDELDRCGRF